MPKTLRYGATDRNAGDLYLPDARRPRVIVLLHGGFWRAPYGRDQLSAMASDLCHRGFAVWNVGYRLLGDPGVGWPEISSDVVAAVEYLRAIDEREHALDLEHVAVVGHSAGGHLALACMARRVRPALTVSLAGVTDREAAFALDLGGGAACSLMGGSPAERPEQYAAASPIRLLPHASPHIVLMHGTEDTAVPISQSRAYAEAARKAGNHVSLVELTGAGHMDFIDPGSKAYQRLAEWMERPWPGSAPG